jgi:hypothetical protein
VSYKKVAYIGSISYKKGPQMLLQCFKAIHELDQEYTFQVRLQETGNPPASLYNGRAGRIQALPGSHDHARNQGFL